MSFNASPSSLSIVSFVHVDGKILKWIEFVVIQRSEQDHINAVAVAGYMQLDVSTLITGDNREVGNFHKPLVIKHLANIVVQLLHEFQLVMG